MFLKQQQKREEKIKHLNQICPAYFMLYNVDFGAWMDSVKR